MKRSILLLLLLGALDGRAATTTGSLRGSIASAGVPVEGARVVAYCFVGAAAPETISAPDGSYWFPQLTPGDCELTFSKPGLQTLTQRAEVLAGTETRADVVVEPSAEGENITATSVKLSLLESSTAVWSIDEEVLAFLPHARTLDAVRSLGPGTFDGASGAPAIIEGIERRDRSRLGLVDAIGPITTVIAGAAPELGSASGKREFVSLRAHSLFDATARLTAQRHRRSTKVAGEVTAGGFPLEKVHLFGAYRRGALQDEIPDDQWLTAVDVAPLRNVAFRGVLLGNSGRIDWSARGEHQVGSAVTVDANASDGDARNFGVRGGWLLPAGPGAHELRAGIERRKTDEGSDAWFVRDHWYASRHWSFDAGVRVEEGTALPRGGLVFDAEGEGTRRIAASYGEYADGAAKSREAALTYATQWDGTIRASGTLLHRTGDEIATLTGVVLDISYSYLVFNFGGNATFGRRGDDTEQNATAWVIADAPLLEHDVNVGIVERLRGDFLATDLAVTYSWTIGRAAPQAKLEFENVFGDDRDPRFPDARPRAIRLGAGIRFGLD